MIKPLQIGVIVSGVVLTLALYFYADTKGPVKAPVVTTGGHAGGDSVPSFDFVLYKQGQLNKIAADQKLAIATLEDKANMATDKAVKKDLYNQLIALCEKNKLDAIACVYSKQIAAINNTYDGWVKTGDDYSQTYGTDSIATNLRMYLVQGAMESYQKASDLKPSDTDIKIKLAGTYMDGQVQPMVGVQMLLKIVAADSNNVKAQFILGRYGMISGQYDKAVVRLTKVTQLEPKNTDAWFLLAQANQALGKKDKAIEYFVKCKSLVDDPQLSTEIDNIIQQIKKS